MYSIEACRICLQQKPEQNIKPTSSVNEDNGASFLELLEYCVNEVNWSSDDFPSLLCDDCIKDLLNAGRFKSRCIESDVCRRKYIEEHSDIKKATEVNLVVKSAEEVKEEPIDVKDAETNDNCDVELKIDVEETKVECNETNECIEKQKNKPISEEQNKFPPYIDISKCFCSLCNRTFTRKALEHHIQNVHTTKKKAKLTLPSYINKVKCFCTLCNRTFTKKALWRHVRRVHNSESNSNKQPRKKRIFPSYIDKEKCFCTLCNRTYIKSSLWLHVQGVHSTEKNYKCDFCPEAFTTSTKLNRHKLKHSDKQNYICCICGKTFLTWSNLKCHIDRHENKKQYVCDVCGKGYNALATMQFHKRTLHMNRDNWKYECNKCGKKFYARSMLNVHVKRHLKVKEHACPLCDQKFVTKSEVAEHRLRHLNVRLKKCDICGAEYKGSRKIHLKDIHGIGTIKETAKNKKYSCDECPKKFITKKVLERHKNSHSGLKPYSCSECDKKFACEMYVKRHLVKLHGIME